MSSVNFSTGRPELKVCASACSSSWQHGCATHASTLPPQVTETWDFCIENTVRKLAYGTLAGGLAAMILFRAYNMHRTSAQPSYHPPAPLRTATLRSSLRDPHQTACALLVLLGRFAFCTDLDRRPWRWCRCGDGLHGLQARIRRHRKGDRQGPVNNGEVRVPQLAGQCMQEFWAILGRRPSRGWDEAQQEAAAAAPIVVCNPCLNFPRVPRSGERDARQCCGKRICMIAAYALCSVSTVQCHMISLLVSRCCSTGTAPPVRLPCMRVASMWYLLLRLAAPLSPLWH